MRASVLIRSAHISSSLFGRSTDGKLNACIMQDTVWSKEGHGGALIATHPNLDDGAHRAIVAAKRPLAKQCVTYAASSYYVDEIIPSSEGIRDD